MLLHKVFGICHAQRALCDFSVIESINGNNWRVSGFDRTLFSSGSVLGPVQVRCIHRLRGDKAYCPYSRLLWLGSSLKATKALRKVEVDIPNINNGKWRWTFLILITEICEAPTLRLKALNKHSITQMMYIEMEMLSAKHTKNKS